MLFHEGARVIADSRSNPLSEKLLKQHLAIAVRDAFQQRNIERAEFRCCRPARLIALFHIGVCCRERRGIEPATLNQKIAPQNIGIASEQCVVEVKQCESGRRCGTHGWRRCQAFGRVKV